MSGYSEDELIDIRQRYNLRFPPDLEDIYRERRSVILGDDFDWINTPRSQIERMLMWPLEGMLFDVENNGFWLPEWGAKPKKRSAQEEIVHAAIATAPKLIPIYGHRYIPEEPHAHGNPIFSVYQTDIIYYGANLDDYFVREGNFHSETWPKIRRIPFWSELAGDSGDDE